MTTPPMALTNPSLNRSGASQAAADPFAMQLALSTVHARLVPMRRGTQGYELDPKTSDWFELPSGRGFAGYGLGRALRMLLDVLRGLTALHDTFDATGENFAHGDVALPQLRVDTDGVCRLVPLTDRHALNLASAPAREALGHLAPERLLGEPVDVRADVFSAGALLWEALAGRRLFEETTGDAIIDRLMGEKLQMPQLPPELAWAIPLKAVAARALSVDPYQRFADCAELATAIAIVARDRVATHAEIATFFGAPVRSVERPALESVHPGPDESALSALLLPSSARSPASDGSSISPAPSRRPIPTSSSTFPAVTVPSSARRSSTLAPLGPARSLTPAPSGRPTPAPARAPSRSEPHLSPFSALLSAEGRAPSSEPPGVGRRSATLISLGTPPSAIEARETAPESSVTAPPSSGRPPPLPPWTQVPSVPSQLQTSQQPAVPAATPALTPEPTSDEVVQFCTWSARRSWLLLALVAVAAVSAWVGFAQTRAAPGPAALTRPPARAVGDSPATATRAARDGSDTSRPGVPGSALVAPANAPRGSDATPTAPSVRPSVPGGKVPTSAKSTAKDYGI